MVHFTPLEPQIPPYTNFKYICTKKRVSSCKRVKRELQDHVQDHEHKNNRNMNPMRDKNEGAYPGRRENTCRHGFSRRSLSVEALTSWKAKLMMLRNK